MKRKPEPTLADTGQTAQAAVQAGVDTMGTAMTGLWQSMSGMSLPMDTLAKLQGEYLQQATAMWNNSLTSLQHEGAAKAPVGDKRFAAEA